MASGGPPKFFFIDICCAAGDSAFYRVASAGSGGLLVLAICGFFLNMQLMSLRPFSCTFHPVDNICANIDSPYFPRSFLRAGQSPQNVGEHSLGYMPNGPTIDYRLS